jgi:putative SOS response-associated peptidase YedK
MCGRITAYNSKAPLKIDRYQIDPGVWIGAFARRPVVPGEQAPVVFFDHQGERKPWQEQPDESVARCLPALWGLSHPGRPGQQGELLFNSRLERWLTEPAGFYAQHQLYPALVPVISFYERNRSFDARALGAESLFDQQALLLAGVMQPIRPDEEERSLRFSLLTRPASAIVQPVHARMPVILRPEHAARWIEVPPDYRAQQAFWQQLVGHRLAPQLV